MFILIFFAQQEEQTLLTYLTWTVLSLATTRHFEQAWGRPQRRTSRKQSTHWKPQQVRSQKLRMYHASPGHPCALGVVSSLAYQILISTSFFQWILNICFEALFFPLTFNMVGKVKNRHRIDWADNSKFCSLGGDWALNKSLYPVTPRRGSLQKTGTGASSSEDRSHWKSTSTL